MHRQPMDNLPAHPLLSGLGPADLERMQSNSERIVLETGESLFDAGDEAHRFFIVLGGQLKLYQLSATGQEKVVELLTPNRTFAEAVMFLKDRRYPVYCEALTQAEVGAFNANVFLDLLRASPETTFKLLGELSRKLRARMTDIEALAFQNATLRVVGFLLGQIPADAVDEVSIELPFAKKVVAARLSLQPETLSRVFAKLRDQGLLRLEGGFAHLPDIPRLQKLAWES